MYLLLKGLKAVSIKLEELNQMNKVAFIEEIGFTFEHSPWIAEQVWYSRPFSSVSDLHEAMINTVDKAEINKKLDLLKAHPDLAATVKMTTESVKEQTGVGLDLLSPEERGEFLELNQAYTEKFGFPFIMAVRLTTKNDIKVGMKRRIMNDRQIELKTALEEIYKIARLRLDDLI